MIEYKFPDRTERIRATGIKTEIMNLIKGICPACKKEGTVEYDEEKFVMKCKECGWSGS